MNVREKTKDNIKIIMNLALYYECHNMELFNDELCITKPNIFSLNIVHNFLFINNLRVCDFFMDMLQI